MTIDKVDSLNALEGYTEYNDGWWYVERDLSEEQFNSLNVVEEFNKLSMLIQ